MVPVGGGVFVAVGVTAKVFVLEGVGLGCGVLVAFGAKVGVLVGFQACVEVGLPLPGGRVTVALGRSVALGYADGTLVGFAHGFEPWKDVG